PRNLVIVIPPPCFPLKQGQLGNILSKGPQHRLSHGILMPLFPSANAIIPILQMFGQLTAIVREYNFPSTLGLCLYLHINEGGVMMTPRISEDSWQYLFGHLFDGHPTLGGQLPIGGSIEFDIDLNKARWFDAWVSGNLRDSYPVSPPFLDTRWQGEFQTINVDKPPVEDRWNATGSRTPVASSQPETRRHLPKKLSLVDRLEQQHGVHAPQDYPNHPDSTPTHGTFASSPILQSSSPRVAQSDLERRVHSWRTNTEFSIVENYQPASDVKISMDVATMERHSEQEVDIDEFLWSITSVGPHSSATESPIVSSRPSSVHPDHRANETVPLSSTTKTSWGPADDERHSGRFSVAQLPSPGLEERVVEDVMVPRLSAVSGDSFLGNSLPIARNQETETLTNPNVYFGLDTCEISRPFEPANVKLPVSYPLLDVYTAGYPWSLESIHPAITIDDPPAVESLQPQYPCIRIHPVVYPFVEPYPMPDSIHIPGTLDDAQYESAKASLASLEPKPVDAASGVHPRSISYPASPMQMPQQEQAVQDADDGEFVAPHAASAVQSHSDLHPPSPMLMSQQEQAVQDADDGELVAPHAASAVRSHSDLYPPSPMLMSQQEQAVLDPDDGELATPHLASAFHSHSDLYLASPMLMSQQEQAIHDPDDGELATPHAATAVHPYSNFYPDCPVLVPEQEQVVQDADDGELATPHAASAVHPHSDFYPDSPVLVPQPEQAVQDELTTPQATSAVHPYSDFYLDSPVLVPQQEQVVQDELTTPHAASVVHPHSDFYPDSPVPEQQVVQDADDGQLVTPLLRTKNTRRRQRRNHLDLRASVFRFAGKQPARSPKTHLHLHAEVFQDGVVWTPSGSKRDLLSRLNMQDHSKRRRREKPARKSQRPPSLDISKARSSRPRSGIIIAQSPQKLAFPLPPAQRSISPLRVRKAEISEPPLGVSEMPMPRVVQPPVNITAPPEQHPDLSPPISPHRVRSPEIPGLDLAVSEAPRPWPQPPHPRVRDVPLPLPVKPLPLPPVPTRYIRSPRSPSPPLIYRPEIPSKQSLDIAVSETPRPRVPSPSSAYMPRRTASARLSEAVKSMARMSGRKRQSSNVAEDARERARSPMRMLSMVDRRPVVTHEVPLTNTTPFLSRSLSAKESLVLGRVKAYEESIQATQSSGTNRSYTPYILRPLSSIPSN
ncbi:hypothetical protein EV363DRAFT_1522044, partial [Boletus edulis]